MQCPAPLSEPPVLAECTGEALALLTQVEQAIWIYDLTHHRVVWANRAALMLWKADSLSELMARKFDPTSPGTAERLANLRLRLARGESLIDPWVLYPLGQPLSVRGRFTGVLVPSGEIGMMVEVLPPETSPGVPGSDRATYELRAIEAVRQAPLMISLVTQSGAWLMHNPAAEALIHQLGHHNLPGTDNFVALFADPARAAILRDTAVRDGSALDTLRIADGRMRMHEVTVRRLIDPATGDLSLIISQQDVTRAYRLERRLRKALTRERAVAELQRQFLAVTSHDFRTPLTIIDGAARRIVKLAGATPGIADRIESIRRAVKRMSESIDKTLTAEMIAEGKAEFRPQPTDLALLLSHMVAGQLSLHPDRPIVLDLPDLPPLTLDPALIERVFENVVGNAIKYSLAGQPVHIAARVEARAVIVTVADRGMGIPKDDLSQLFARYFRGGNARGVKGTGVGLHAVRLIMNLHKGTVAISSREGEGTSVRLTFPLPPA